jgi:TrpR-related protein YerC/YecD
VIGEKVMSGYVSKLETPEMDYLVDAIRSLKTREEVYRFLEDVCTINEIKAMEQRLQVARMLKERRTYLDIASSTGASTATISRVNRSLNYGNNGYKVVFERVDWKEYEDK